MKYTDLAVDYFERHSTSNECHITSDGRVFHTSGHAISFASENDLQDQTIESYTREQVATLAENANVENTDENVLNDVANIDTSNLEVQLDETKQNENSNDETDLSGFDSQAGQIALDVFLANNDVEKIEYKDLKALVKHFEIETADQKADTLRTALTEYKNNLAQ